MHVLHFIEDYRLLTGKGRGLLEAMSMAALADIDVNPPRARIETPHTDSCCGTKAYLLRFDRTALDANSKDRHRHLTSRPRATDRVDLAMSFVR